MIAVSGSAAEGRRAQTPRRIMGCEEIKNLLPNVLYDDDAVEAHHVAAHLRTCADCSRELSELRATRNLLAEWTIEEPKRNLMFVKPKTGWTEPLKRLFSNRHFSVARVGSAILISCSAVLVLLSLANTHVTWEKGKFSFRTSLFNQPDQAVNERENAYIDEQLLQIIDSMLVSSEMRQARLYNLMLQEALDQSESRYQRETLQIQQDLDAISQNYWRVLEENARLKKQSKRPKEKNF